MAIIKVSYYPQKLAERLEPAGAMISITSPGDEPPLLPGWKHLLRLCFPDIERSDDNQEPLSETEAAVIIQFLNSLPADVDHLHIHCSAGVSRSVAVARYACQRYGVHFDEERGCTFNRLVYRRLVKAAGMEPIPEPYPDPVDAGDNIIP